MPADSRFTRFGQQLLPSVQGPVPADKSPGADQGTGRNVISTPGFAAQTAGQSEQLRQAGLNRHRRLGRFAIDVADLARVAIDRQLCFQRVDLVEGRTRGFSLPGRLAGIQKNRELASHRPAGVLDQISFGGDRLDFRLFAGLRETIDRVAQRRGGRLSGQKLPTICFPRIAHVFIIARGLSCQRLSAEWLWPIIDPAAEFDFLSANDDAQRTPSTASIPSCTGPRCAVGSLLDGLGRGNDQAGATPKPKPTTPFFPTPRAELVGERPGHFGSVAGGGRRSRQLETRRSRGRSQR